MSVIPEFDPWKGCHCKLCSKNIPTVKPHPNFDPDRDASLLRSALRGFTIDEDVIVGILGKRTVEQRQKIQFAYWNAFNRELLVDLKSKLSGDLEHVVVSLFYKWPQQVAKQVQKALNEFSGSDVKTLVNLLLTASNCQLQEIKMAYSELFEAELEENLNVKLHGDSKHLFAEILQGHCMENAIPDHADDSANNMGQKLSKSALLSLFTNKSCPVLVELEKSYANHTSMNLESLIEEDFSGDLLFALNTILQIARNKYVYFAESIHAALACDEANDLGLVDLVVLRSEIDLGNISLEYQKIYKTSLAFDLSRSLVKHSNKYYTQLILDIII